MQKNITQIKCIVGGKEVILSCDIESTTLELKEALFQFIKHIGQVEDAHVERLKQEQENPVEIKDESNAEIIEE